MEELIKKNLCDFCRQEQKENCIKIKEKVIKNGKVFKCMNYKKQNKK